MDDLDDLDDLYDLAADIAREHEMLSEQQQPESDEDDDDGEDPDADADEGNDADTDMDNKDNKDNEAPDVDDGGSSSNWWHAGSSDSARSARCKHYAALEKEERARDDVPDETAPNDETDRKLAKFVHDLVRHGDAENALEASTTLRQIDVERIW